MNEKELIMYREMLQQLVTGLGRDHIRVGEVAHVDGKIVFTLTRGGHSHQAELPLDVLADKERARAAMMSIIPKIRKVIERQHLQAAQDKR